MNKNKKSKQVKEVVIWRVWGGELPCRSLVRKSDHSYTVASWYTMKKQGTIWIPQTRERLSFKSYNTWLKSAAKHFSIENKIISW